jgi:hypothetical protein
MSKINIYRVWNISVDLETLEFKVPIVCLVTGCVSLCRDRRYKDRRDWDVLSAVVVSRKIVIVWVFKGSDTWNGW